MGEGGLLLDSLGRKQRRHPVGCPLRAARPQLSCQRSPSLLDIAARGRARRATQSPRSANARAAARPTPADAPVTTTTLFTWPLPIQGTLKDLIAIAFDETANRAAAAEAIADNHGVRRHRAAQARIQCAPPYGSRQLSAISPSRRSSGAILLIAAPSFRLLLRPRVPNRW
jgi:hypothetical protein